MLQRRKFVEAALAAAMIDSPGGPVTPAASISPTIERALPGMPHRGKVLALITPHLDDGPIFAGGALAKLLSEGYTGFHSNE